LSEQAKAIAAYREALRLHSRHVPAAANLGFLYFDIGEFARSAELLTQAISDGREWEANTPGQPTDFPKLYVKLGEALAKSGNIESALKQYRVLERFDRTAAAELLKAITGKGVVRWPTRKRSR
jgi:tetratricopeptide (TPR) repeat protein